MSNAPTPTPPPPDPRRAYTKQFRVSAQLRFIAICLAFLAYVLLGISQWSASLAQSATNNFYLQLLICWSALWLLCAVSQLPASLYRFFLDRRFHVAKSGVRSWLRDFLKSCALGFAFGAAIVGIAFASNNVFPSSGWLLAGLLASFLFMAFNRSLPWILSFFYPVLPLAKESLQERLTQLAAKAHLRVGTIYEWRISEKTRRANALVTGIGSARRILLTDTLISSLSEDEVDAIVAHELGHCALHHVRARLLLQSLIFVAIFYVIGLAVRHRLVIFTDGNGSWSDLTLVPGFFIFWSLGYLYGNVLLNGLSRKQERAADLYSWTLLGRSGPFITAMRKLTELNLFVFDKKSEWRFTHPATSDRIAAAEEFAKAHGETLSVAQVGDATAPVRA
ncbi:MAG TPA: M48 family metalloprotease [Candidatus Acidoferrum sp.]|nr:M48 family metalloprotease [Candidatus Acidoferrum sp.]